MVPMTSATFNQLFSYAFHPALFFSGTKVNPDIAGAFVFDNHEKAHPRKDVGGESKNPARFEREFAGFRV